MYWLSGYIRGEPQSIRRLADNIGWNVHCIFLMWRLLEPFLFFGPVAMKVLPLLWGWIYSLIHWGSLGKHRGGQHPWSDFNLVWRLCHCCSFISATMCFYSEYIKMGKITVMPLTCFETDTLSYWYGNQKINTSDAKWAMIGVWVQTHCEPITLGKQTAATPTLLWPLLVKNRSHYTK